MSNVFSRLWAFSFDKRYVDGNPENDFELKKDPEILNKIQTTNFKRGLVHLLLKVFAEYNDKITADPSSMIKVKSAWGLGAESSNDTPFHSFLEEFKITGDNDFYASWKFDKWIEDKGFNTTSHKLWQDIEQYAKINKISGLDKSRDKKAINSKGKVSMIKHFVGIREKTEQELLEEKGEDDDNEDDNKEGSVPTLPNITALSLTHSTGISVVDESLIDSNDTDISYVNESTLPYEFNGFIYYYSCNDFKQGQGFRGFKVFMDADLREPVGKLLIRDDNGHTTFTLDKVSD